MKLAKDYRVKRIPCVTVIYVISDARDNQIADLGAKRKQCLDRLSEKHGLGELTVENFAILLEEPEIKREKQKVKLFGVVSLYILEFIVRKEA